MGSREFCLPSAISSWIYRTISCHGHLAPSLLLSACCFDLGVSAFLSHFVSLSLWTGAYGQLLFYTFTGSVFFVPRVGGGGAGNSGKLRDKDDFLFQVIDPVVVSGFFPFVFNPFILCMVDDRAVAHIWRPEVNLWESVLSVHHLGSKIELRLSG